VAERNQLELRGCEGWYHIYDYNKHNYNHKYKYSIRLDVRNIGRLIKYSDAKVRLGT